MFSSNQEFCVTGEVRDKEQVALVIKALLEGYRFKTKSYEIKDGTFILYDFNEENSGNVIDVKDCNPNYISQLVELYFCSSAYNIALTNTVSDCRNLDGSLTPGWKLEVVENSYYKRVIIIPFWCFYHK